MSAETDKAALREGLDTERGHVLVKRGLYWRPQGQGYTGLLAEAGRYSGEQAAAHTDHDADSTQAMPVSEAPEFAPACWPETKIAALTKQRDDARAQAEADRAEIGRLAAKVEARVDEALRKAIRAWSARLHVPVTRMMSRALREEFQTALRAADKPGERTDG